MTNARPALVLALCAAGLLAGCGADLAKPDPPPSPAMLAAMRTSPFPVYWLGPDYRRAVLNSAQLAADSAVVKYGQPACSKQTCDYPIVVTSLAGWDDLVFAPRGAVSGPVCFSHLGRAVLMGCPHDPRVLIFTGRSLIELDTWQPDFVVRAVAAMLRPLSRSAPPLSAPTQRVNCASVKTIDPQIAAALPRALRPLNCQ